MAITFSDNTGIEEDPWSSNEDDEEIEELDLDEELFSIYDEEFESKKSSYSAFFEELFSTCDEESVIEKFNTLKSNDDNKIYNDLNINDSEPSIFLQKFFDKVLKDLSEEEINNPFEEESQIFDFQSTINIISNYFNIKEKNVFDNFNNSKVEEINPKNPIFISEIKNLDISYDLEKLYDDINFLKDLKKGLLGYKISRFNDQIIKGAIKKLKPIKPKSIIDKENWFPNIFVELVKILSNSINIHNEIKECIFENKIFPDYLIEYLEKRLRGKEASDILEALISIKSSFNITGSKNDLPIKSLEQINNNKPVSGIIFINSDRVNINSDFDSTLLDLDEIKKINDKFMLPALKNILKNKDRNIFMIENIVSIDASRKILEELKDKDKLLTKFIKPDLNDLEKLEKLLENRDLKLKDNDIKENINLYNMISQNFISINNYDSTEKESYSIFKDKISNLEWREILVKFQNIRHYENLYKILRKKGFSEERIKIFHEYFYRINKTVITIINTFFIDNNELKKSDFNSIFSNIEIDYFLAKGIKKIKFLEYIKKDKQFKIDDIKEKINVLNINCLTSNDKDNIENILKNNINLDNLEKIIPYFDKIKLNLDEETYIHDIYLLYNGYEKRNTINNSYYGSEKLIVDMVNNAIKLNSNFFHEFIQEIDENKKNKIMNLATFINNKTITFDSLSSDFEKSNFLKMWRSLLSIYYNDTIFIYTPKTNFNDFEYLTKPIEIKNDGNENEKDNNVIDNLFSEIENEIKGTPYYYYLKYYHDINNSLYKNNTILDIKEYLESDLFKYVKSLQFFDKKLKEFNESLNEIDSTNIENSLNEINEKYRCFIGKISYILQNNKSSYKLRFLKKLCLIINDKKDDSSIKKLNIFLNNKKYNFISKEKNKQIEILEKFFDEFEIWVKEK